MNLQSLKQLIARRHLQPGRRVLAAALMVGLGVALLAGGALAAAGTNLVKNGSFEKDTNGDGMPNRWGGYLLSSADKRVSNTSAAGTWSFKMVANSYKNLTQFIFQPGLAGDSFTFSGWMKHKDLGVGGVRLAVVFEHTGGGDNYETIEFPAGTGAWAYHSVVATADANYDDIIVYLICDGTGGKLWVDKVKLVGP